MEGEMCTSMCQIRPPKKRQTKQNTVNYLCDTKALIVVSYRIRPTSDIICIEIERMRERDNERERERCIFLSLSLYT